MDFLSEQFRKRPLAEWDEYLATLDICYGRVNTPREALSHPHLNKRGMIVSDGQGRNDIAPPIHFRNEPACRLTWSRNSVSKTTQFSKEHESGAAPAWLC